MKQRNSKTYFSSLMLSYESTAHKPEWHQMLSKKQLFQNTNPVKFLILANINVLQLRQELDSTLATRTPHEVIRPIAGSPVLMTTMMTTTVMMMTITMIEFFMFFLCLTVRLRESDPLWRVHWTVRCRSVINNLCGEGRRWMISGRREPSFTPLENTNTYGT